MSGFSKKGMAIGGAALAFLGVLAIAVPVFTTHETSEVAKIGDLKITAKEETSYAIPPLVGWAALGIGAGLMGRRAN